MPVEPRVVARSGRSVSWRAALALVGATCCAVGVAVIVWPALLAYAVGGVFLALGAFLLLSGLAARGR